MPASGSLNRGAYHNPGYTTRPAVYEYDQQAVIALLVAYRAATCVRVYPTAWRFRLLWSSRVWEPSLDTRLWQDRDGQTLGFAMLWRRVRMGGNPVLEPVVHPAFVNTGLVDAMLHWGLARARQIAENQVEPVTLYSSTLAPPVFSERNLQASGFAPLPPNPASHNIYFSKPLQNALPKPELPPGCRIRPLAAGSDLEKYGALYGFAVVSPQHRLDQLVSDEYHLLVVEASDGALLAYCESSLCRAEWQASDMKIGWIDYIETDPEQRGCGLGKAVLLASLARLRASGVEETLLVTASDNTTAIHLYQSVGFERVESCEALSYQLQLG